MRILHFHRALFDRSETFIRRYIEQSLAFGEVGAAASEIHDIPIHLSKNNITYFQIPEKYYTRKSFNGTLKYINEKLTGKVFRERKFAAFIRGFNPDVIHCHFGPMGVFMSHILEAYKIPIPFATSFYGLDASSMPKNNKAYRCALNKLWERGNAFFAEGPELGNKLIDLGAQSSKVMINPLIVPANDYPPRKTEMNKNKPIQFLMVGRFAEKKGFHLALEALGQLKNEIPEFEITMIGYGELENRYKEIIAKHQIGDHVHFLGGKNHSGVIQALQEHDVFIHPSLLAQNGDSEGGAPTIIIEAQAVGIPVIASTHADIPFVMGYHDFLADEGSIDSLKEKIKKAVSITSWEKCLASGRKKVLEQHGNSTIYFNNLGKLLAE